MAAAAATTVTSSTLIDGASIDELTVAVIFLWNRFHISNNVGHHVDLNPLWFWKHAAVNSWAQMGNEVFLPQMGTVYITNPGSVFCQVADGPNARIEKHDEQKRKKGKRDVRPSLEENGKE